MGIPPACGRWHSRKQPVFSPGRESTVFARLPYTAAKMIASAFRQWRTNEEFMVFYLLGNWGLHAYIHEAFKWKKRTRSDENKARQRMKTGWKRTAIREVPRELGGYK